MPQRIHGAYVDVDTHDGLDCGPQQPLLADDPVCPFHFVEGRVAPMHRR